MNETWMMSPIGQLRLRASERGLAEVMRLDVRGEGASDAPLLTEAVRQLSEYFAGERREFDLPLDLQGTTFQREVWAELGRIPCGETISYRTLAQRVGRPKAVRAVGAANGRNRLTIVVPCHRVIGADGTLTGYAGGLEMKRWLLDRERYAGSPAIRRETMSDIAITVP